MPIEAGVRGSLSLSLSLSRQRPKDEADDPTTVRLTGALRNSRETGP